TKGCLIANFATVPIAELRQRVEAGEQKTKLAREFGISRETLYQYLRTDQ
ncbi:TPA: Hin recombinase, partial [Escherichia coli]